MVSWVDKRHSHIVEIRLSHGLTSGIVIFWEVGCVVTAQELKHSVCCIVVGLSGMIWVMSLLMEDESCFLWHLARSYLQFLWTTCIAEDQGVDLCSLQSNEMLDQIDVSRCEHLPSLWNMYDDCYKMRYTVNTFDNDNNDSCRQYGPSLSTYDNWCGHSRYIWLW